MAKSTRRVRDEDDEAEERSARRNRRDDEDDRDDEKPAARKRLRRDDDEESEGLPAGTPTVYVHDECKGKTGCRAKSFSNTSITRSSWAKIRRRRASAARKTCPGRIAIGRRRSRTSTKTSTTGGAKWSRRVTIRDPANRDSTGSSRSSAPFSAAPRVPESEPSRQSRNLHRGRSIPRDPRRGAVDVHRQDEKHQSVGGVESQTPEPLFQAASGSQTEIREAGALARRITRRQFPTGHRTGG